MERATRFLRRTDEALGPRVLTVTGPGGVGKSAFAIHVATLLKDEYPAGHLYADLRGQGDQPLDPGDVLDAFLRALGVAGSRIPADTGERALMYRAALSGSGTIVVLDNAHHERQVRPLIPGGAGSIVLITSRRALAALEGTFALPLHVLDEDDSVTLLGRIAGPERVTAEPEAALEIVRLCGRLPLAIRIVGGKLVSRSHWRLGRMADRLRVERTRLAELRLGDLDVRGGFMLGYDGLEDESQRALRLPSLLTFPTFTAWTLAALLDTDLDDAESLAERLVDLQLFEVVGEDATGEFRYRYHDLLRLFARERVTEETPPAERSAAVERALGALLYVAKRALYHMSPHSMRDPDPSLALLWPLPEQVRERLAEQPYEWFTAEYDNLIAAIRQAHAAGLWECTWELADSLHYYFRVRARWKDWRETHELALDAARRVGNRRGEGWTLRNLGNAYRDNGDPDRAVECYRLCLETFESLGNDLGRAAALNNLGELAMDHGRLTEAVGYFQRCLPAWAEAGDPVGVAYVTNHLAWVAIRQGRWADAEEGFSRSLAMFRDLGDRWGEAHALRSIGVLARERGALTDADGPLAQSASLFADFGDRAGQAWARTDLAWAHLVQGRRESASSLLDAATTEFRDLSERAGEAWCLMVRADLYRADGDTDTAAALLEEVTATFRLRGERYEEGVACCLLAEAYAGSGRADLARSAFTDALDVLREVGAAAWAARAERGLSLETGL